MTRRLLPAFVVAAIAVAQPDQVIRTAPQLPLRLHDLAVQKPSPEFALDMVTSVTSGPDGVIYLFQRGDKADPVIAVSREGKVLRSWGRGLYTIPHSIRVDPKGNVWTVDAGSSMVHQFTPRGKKLLEISVGGQPAAHRSAFKGTTDIAFAPDGRLLIADGYANARIVEYSPDGRRLREWGTPGTGPGQFHLPHGITVDPKGVIYVADRENGRIQRFDPQGKYLGEWTGYGKTFSITWREGALWIGTQPRDQPNGAPGWIMKLDPATGKLLGWVPSIGHHSVEATARGEVLTGTRPDRVLWFR